MSIENILTKYKFVEKPPFFICNRIDQVKELQKQLQTIQNQLTDLFPNIFKNETGTQRFFQFSAKYFLEGEIDGLIQMKHIQQSLVNYFSFLFYNKLRNYSSRPKSVIYQVKNLLQTKIITLNQKEQQKSDLINQIQNSIIQERKEKDFFLTKINNETLPKLKEKFDDIFSIIEKPPRIEKYLSFGEEKIKGI